MGLRENLWQDRLAQLEITEPVIVSPSTPTRGVVERMRAKRVGCALICEGTRLIGIFTERDLIKRVLAPGGDPEAPVQRFMTPDPVITGRDSSIGSVIQTMHRGHYRHLPVVDENGRPIGTVGVKRVVQYLVDHFPRAVYNLPPRPWQAQETREGA